MEVTITLTIPVNTPEDQAYLLDKDSKATVYFIADLWDSLDESFIVPVDSINGFTKEDIRRKLTEAAGV